MSLADADAYHFLISFWLPDNYCINSDDPSIALAGVASGGRLELRAEGSSSLKEARRLRLSGHGYAAKHAAITAHKRAQIALSLAALESFFGVEMDKTATGEPDVFKGIQARSRQSSEMRATALGGTNAAVFRERLTDWMSLERPLTDDEDACVALLSDYHFDLNNRSRFLLEQAAIERLCSISLEKDQAYVEALDKLMGDAWESLQDCTLSGRARDAREQGELAVDG